MSEWLAHFFHAFADQAGTWFVGIVLAIFGLFPARLVEKIRFALNRADARAKYYEEMAIDISHFVFIIDRLVKVSFGSTWARDDDKSGIAQEYNEVMNTLSRKEYVYRSWVRRFWDRKTAIAFDLTMDRIKAVDQLLILINEDGEQKDHLQELDAAFRDLRQAACDLLTIPV